MKQTPLYKNKKFLLILIVLFGIILRLAFFTGMTISDPLAYSKAANDINIGKGIDPASTLTLSTRLGIVYATAFSYRIFGINDFSSVSFTLLTSIGSIILIYYFGKLLFDENIGLTAAFLLSFFPLDVVYSTQLVSDIPSAFFMSLGVYVFLYSEIKNKTNYWSYLLSGLLIGIGYLIRESALLIALFFVAYILYKRKLKFQYFMVPLGVLIVIMLEMLVFMNLTGDPFFRFTTSQDYLKEASALHNYFGRLDFPIGLLHYPWMFLTNELLSAFYIFASFAALYFLMQRKKKTYTLLLWLIPLLIYLSFGSGSLTKYVPFRAVDRYTMIFTIPAILLLALFLKTNKFIEKKKLMTFSIGILMLSSIFAAYLHDNRNQLGRLRELSAEILAFQKPIYIDERSLLALNYISGFKNSADLRQYPDDMSKISDSYVIINAEMIRNLKEANPAIILPKETEKIPSSWQLIKETGTKEKISIYEAR